MIWLRLALTALLTGIALVGAGIWWLQQNLVPVVPAAEPVLFDVLPGASLKRIAQQLETAGLVRNARAVELLARHRRLAGALQAGEYRLSAALPPDAILELIAEGRVATHELVVPEGFTAAMIAERLAGAGLGDAAEFLAWVRDPASAAAHGVEGSSLEGYLFPDTYHLPRGLDARATAAVFVGQFEQVWSEIEPRAKTRGLSMREVVTLASIVEKETGAPQERPLIAAVFLNRMKRGMRLETDPTVIYGISDFDGNLRRRDLENRENPYNTYVIPGLPPGPIASPGRDALLAVVEPAATEFLFFVSRNDGTHRFSRTFAEHELAVNEFQRRRRSR
jgi:UPF0755 protein